MQFKLNFEKPNTNKRECLKREDETSIDIEKENKPLFTKEELDNLYDNHSMDENGDKNTNWSQY